MIMCCCWLLRYICGHLCFIVVFHFFFNDTATTESYTYLHTLSLHDALPISPHGAAPGLALHHLVPYAVSRLSAGPHGHPGVAAMAIHALVPPAVGLCAGAHPHRTRHRGRAGPGESAGVVARRRCRAFPSGAARCVSRPAAAHLPERGPRGAREDPGCVPVAGPADRKSTRLNSSH